MSLRCSIYILKFYMIAGYNLDSERGRILNSHTSLILYCMPLLTAQKRRKMRHSPWWLSGHNKKASNALGRFKSILRGRCKLAIPGSFAPKMHLVCILPHRILFHREHYEAFLNTYKGRWSGGEATAAHM